MDTAPADGAPGDTAPGDGALPERLAHASRVLVLRALGLGDLLAAVPALRAVRRAAPRARLELACPGWLAPVVDLVGGVDVQHHVAPLEPLPEAAAGADVAVNLHGRGPQSTRLLLDTSPGTLVAFRSAALPETAGLPEHDPPGGGVEHERERWCRLLREGGVPADPRDLTLRPPDPDPAVPPGARVVHPGSASPTRRWPPERWAAVARALGGGAGGTGRVVLSGSAAERDGLLRLAAAAGLPDEAVVAGRTSLWQLAGLVAAAELVVSADTGTGHLATAFGTPSVVLFGPVPPQEWGPPAGAPQHLALWPGPASDPSADRPAPALLATTVADVLAAVAVVRAAGTTGSGGGERGVPAGR